jgi:hypothetical protein
MHHLLQLAIFEHRLFVHPTKTTNKTAAANPTPNPNVLGSCIRRKRNLFGIRNEVPPKNRNIRNRRDCNEDQQWKNE